MHREKASEDTKRGQWPASLGEKLQKNPKLLNYGLRVLISRAVRKWILFIFMNFFIFILFEREMFNHMVQFPTCKVPKHLSHHLLPPFAGQWMRSRRPGCEPGTVIPDEDVQVGNLPAELNVFSTGFYLLDTILFQTPNCLQSRKSHPPVDLEGGYWVMYYTFFTRSLRSINQNYVSRFWIENREGQRIVKRDLWWTAREVWIWIAY